MELRISFRSAVYIKGKTIKDIADKFSELGLYSDIALKHCGADFIELDSVERVDDNSYSDVTEKFELY